MSEISSRMIPLALDNYHAMVLGLTLFVVIAAYRLRQPNRLPDDIPWAGSFTTSFGKMLAPYKAVFRGREYMDEAYHKFSKLDRICVIPSFFENRINLPPSYRDWMLRQPPQKLSGVEAGDEEAKYTMRSKITERKPVFEEFVIRQFKLHLDELMSDLMDEIRFSTDELLGLDTNRYKTLHIHGTLKKIITRTSYRVFVGEPLCRDADFIGNSIRYFDSVAPIGFLIRLLPIRLRSTVGRAFSLVNRFFYLKCARSLSPIISERMTRWHADLDVATNDRPNNWLSWSVDEVMKRETYKTADKKHRWVARRLMNLAFAATETTSYSIPNFILDVFSTRHCMNDLLIECETLNKKFGSEWNRARMTEMRTMDSALRESLRISSITTISSRRRVLAPDGLILPNGSWLPCGSLIELPSYSVHHDESIYPEPLEYRHTRFMQSSKEGTSLKLASTPETTFLNWGYGKHACPGRFFAVDLIKLIMTYLITNYEVIPLSERPRNNWIVEYTIPPLNATLEVRRRAGTVPV